MKRVCILFVPLAAISFLLAACGGPPPSEHVVVTEHDFHILSTESRFTTRTLYHFWITNVGDTADEFLIMPKPEGSLSGTSMPSIESMALAKVVNIPPGQTATLDYTFPSSAAGSHPEFASYLPGHYEAGMHMEVTVGS